EWNRWAAPSHSHLHRPAFDAHRGLAHGFAQCRMRVAGASDVLRGGTELDRERGFGNHVARLCAQDMHPKYAVALGVGDHLGEAVRRGDSLGAGIGGKGELADLVGDAGRLEFFLRLADARNFRRGVDDSGDRIVVDVAGLARDPFGAGDGLVFRLVRQHRALAAIADRPDAGNIGGVVRVGHDATARVELHARLFQTQLVDEGPPPDGDEHDIGLDHLLFPARSRLNGDGEGVLLLLDTDHLGRELEFHALAREDSLKLLADFAVEAGRDAVVKFGHRHFAAEAAPHRAELQTDITAAHHEQALRHLGERERAGRGHNLFFVDRHARQYRDVRAGGHDNALRLQDALRAVPGGDLHLAGSGDASRTHDGL